MKKYTLAITMLCILVFVTYGKPKKDKKVIMAVFAHADDEMDIAPLLSFYNRKGHDVYLVFASRGEKGITEHAKIPAGDSLAKIRVNEASCTCHALGIHAPVFLDLSDGGLKNADGMPLYNKLDSVFRYYQPDVVITWGAEGGYGHIDHRMVHNVVTEIFQSGNHTNTQGLYYIGIPAEHIQAQSVGQDKGWLRKKWKPVKKAYLTARIECDTQDVNIAAKAVLCYRSQFTDEQLQENSLWLRNMDKNTVYLRPFIPKNKIRYDLF